MSRLTAFLEDRRAKRSVVMRTRADMQAAGLRLSRPIVRFSGTSPFLCDCEISRLVSRYTIDFTGPNPNGIPRGLASAYLYWLWHCPPEVSSITVNMSDGDYPSGARFAMSARLPNVVPLPDGFFFQNRGFRLYREQTSQRPVPWQARSDRLRWRGTTSGQGRIEDLSSDAMWDPEVLPRIRMNLILRDRPGCDVAFYSSDRGEPHAESLRANRLLRLRIPESDWINDKFALDIGGYVNTWSNFLARLHLGCCVLKVESQRGYRQWYYDRIRPWEHFVPVRADMSDLVEKIDWVRSHDAEARDIAANGQAFARSMTFESETQWAVAAICAANAKSPV